MLLFHSGQNVRKDGTASTASRSCLLSSVDVVVRHCYARGVSRKRDETRRGDN
jgi:hypothetical protein